MTKTIIFTGAGASAPLGFPTTKEFFENQIANWPGAIQVVDEWLSPILGKKPWDVEDVLGLLVPISDFMETNEGRHLKGHKNLKGTLEALLEFCDSTIDRCFTVYGKSPSRKGVEELYLPILENLDWSGSRLDLFTTNYDLTTNILIGMAENNEISVSNGFGRDGRFSPDREFGKSPLFQVFQVHGSLSWVEETDGSIRNQNHISKTDKQHVFIPPGKKDKPNEFVEGHPIRYAHERLERSLVDAEWLVVIGFAFRDQYLNELIERALKSNAQLRLVNINPETNCPIGKDETIIGSRYNLPTNIKAKFGDDVYLMKLKKLLG